MQNKFNVGDEVYLDGKKGSFWVLSLAETVGGGNIYCISKSLVKKRHYCEESKLIKK
jgi:hypothetical protein